MSPNPKSSLFLIRLWASEDSTPPQGWQGRIQPIGEGKSAAFSDWSTLQAILQEMLLKENKALASEDVGVWDKELSIDVYPNQYR